MICNYCNKEFIKEFKNQVYCTNFCRTRMTTIKKRMRQKKYDGTLRPRTCPRCREEFQFHGMKKLCLSCVKICKIDPYQYKLIKYY